MMSRGHLVFVCLAVLLFATAARAGEKISGVVELFTSQGCNSCPAADAVLAELAQRRDVLALAYHVDYWDYLGWQDSFATRENTHRQKGYKRALGGRSIYTPQAVINGRVEMNGAHREGILRALKEMAMAGAAPHLPIAMARRGDSLVVDVGTANPAETVELVENGKKRAAHLVVVAFGPPTPVNIGHGENGGRTIVYWNPVLRVQPMGVWNGAAAHFELPWAAGPGEGVAVLLQEMGSGGLPGPILGASVLRRY